MTGTWIAGGYQTDFARNIDREGLGVDALIAETVAATLADARIEAHQVDAIHVGNAFGQLFNGQGQLGAMPATVEPALWGVPAARHEAACASGSIAILSAMRDIEAGHAECVLVLGVEQERLVSGLQAARNLGAAAWVGHEGAEATYMWPWMFSEIADEYDRRYGIEDAHLHALGELAMRNAKDNPLAPTRAWEFGTGSFADDDVANPVVEGRLRRTDCSQVTDGAVGVVLVSERLRRREDPVIAGWGHRTAGLSLQQKFERSLDDAYVFPHLRETVRQAWDRAGVADVFALDAFETHDCFTMSAYLAVDHLGITGPGESWKAIENGDLERNGALPLNPGGGLVGIGHPVGATGVRMLLDATRQVTGRAGDCQVEGASRVGTLNIGGSLTTAVSFVVEAG
jgi:acetyl-CoA C-acetyltransferase